MRRGHIEEFARTHALLEGSPEEATQGLLRSFIPKDRAAWYVYQSELYCHDPTHYDMLQASRIIPVVQRLGASVERLRNIDGAEQRLAKSLRQQSDEIDSTLFELLVSLAYSERGWSNVRFLPETPGLPTPDLSATFGGRELLIECKRKRATSDYARQEREKWIKMFGPVGDIMAWRRIDWCLDITFHKPILDLPDDYLSKRLVPVLSLAIPGTIIDDRELTVRAIAADWPKLRRELATSSLRADTQRWSYLLFGVYRPWGGQTFTVEARPLPDALRYYKEIEWAGGAIYACDAEESIRAKAVHFKRQLADAVRQIPPGVPSAVHIGAEAYDGEGVELERYARIKDDIIPNFDFDSRIVEWVYFHIFAFEVPPDENWAVTEKCYQAVRSHPSFPPLNPGLLIVPGNPDA